MEKVCAGIVLYNPDPERLRENIQSVREQVDEVFLVDNGSESISDIRKQVEIIPNVVLLENGDNLGIATALNKACREAVAKGYTWILTLDQDTVVPDNLIWETDKYMGDPQIGILCPAVYYEGRMEKPEPNDTTECVKACMTSGSLTRISAWEKVGGFREEFFIDYVDNDFCQKLRMNGYTILRVNACIMTHSLGEIRRVKRFGLIEKKYTIHKPWRYYYMIRNNLIFVSDYRKELNVRKEKMKVCYIAAMGCMHTTQKRKTLHYILKGYKDAKAGIMGKMRDD